LTGVYHPQKWNQLNPQKWNQLKLFLKVKVKVIPQQADVAQGVPDSLRLWIFYSTSVVDRQPYIPAAFTPGEIHGNHFQGLS